MMGYKVVEVKDKKQFNVVERRPQFSEEYTIKTFSDKEDARKMSRTLNLGGGFDGWTPSFFLNTAS
jgi:hypothetical protein